MTYTTRYRGGPPLVYAPPPGTPPARPTQLSPWLSRRTVGSAAETPLLLACAGLLVTTLAAALLAMLATRRSGISGAVLAMLAVRRSCISGTVLAATLAATTLLAALLLAPVGRVAWPVVAATVAATVAAAVAATVTATVAATVAAAVAAAVAATVVIVARAVRHGPRLVSVCGVGVWGGRGARLGGGAAHRSPPRS